MLRGILLLLRLNPHWCDITFREEYWIKCLKRLISVIFHNNYYSQFYRPSCELVYQQTPSTEQIILPYSKYNYCDSGSQTIMPQTLPESVLTEFDHCLEICNFSNLQKQIQPQQDYDQILTAQHHWAYVHSITDRSSPSTCSKYCAILQAGHHSNLTLHILLQCWWNVKVRFSPLQALEALRVVRGWGSHIF
jgi:hypothetical protein